MAGRVLTKDLDARLTAVEERIEELVGRVGLLDEQARQFGHTQWLAEQAAAQAAQAVQAAQAAQTAQATHASNGNGSSHAEEEPNGKFAELEALLSRLDERVDKIASTIVASRWASQ